MAVVPDKVLAKTTNLASLGTIANFTSQVDLFSRIKFKILDTKRRHLSTRLLATIPSLRTSFPRTDCKTSLDLRERSQ